MGIIRIAPVTRAGMKLLVSLYGMSETGKTLSGLKLAAGIEPDPSKRALLDTEGGERGRAYMDAIPGGYLYAALTPPFTPQRYRDAVAEIEAAGVNVLVIDSVSHAWFAEGGVLDMVEQSTNKNDMAKWKEPKRRLQHMTNRMLSSNMHIVLCSRGKQPMVEHINENGKKTYVLGPVIPIQEKSLRFDMTVMAQMLGDGRFTVAAPAGKCPGALRPIFAGGELMDEEMGRRLAEWVAGGDAKTPAQRKLEMDARAAAEAGAEAFRGFWKGISGEQREFLKPSMANYQSIAAAADQDAKQRRQEAEENRKAGDLEDPFGDKSGDSHSTDEPEKAPNSPLHGGNWFAWLPWFQGKLRSLPQGSLAGFITEHGAEYDALAETRPADRDACDLIVEDRKDVAA